MVIYHERLRNEYKNGLDAYGTFGINCLTLTAFETAYSQCEGSILSYSFNKLEWLDLLLKYLKHNMKFLKEFFAEYIPKAHVIDIEATYLVWIDFREYGMEYKELEKFMEETCRVYLGEGYKFGKDGQGFERINIACPRSILEKGLIRIRDGLLQNK